MSDILEMLKRHEGLNLKPYADTMGKETIGYGHLIELGESFPATGITLEKAEEILDADLASAKVWVLNHIGCFHVLTPNRQNVILDMAFNLRGRLLGFTNFLAALNAGDYERAAVEMMDSVWAKQVGTRATELADMMRAG